MPPTVRIVGGAVRDALLGRRHTHDLDLVVQGISPISYAKKTRQPFFRGRHGVVRFVQDDLHIDVAPLRGNARTLRSDAMSRDFTINALYYNVNAGRIEDPLKSGRKDIESRILRMPHRRSLDHDPVRVVRALRFVSQFGCSMEESLVSAMETISLERLRSCSRQLLTANLIGILTGTHRFMAVDALGRHRAAAQALLALTDAQLGQTAQVVEKLLRFAACFDVAMEQYNMERTDKVTEGLALVLSALMETEVLPIALKPLETYLVKTLEVSREQAAAAARAAMASYGPSALSLLDDPESLCLWMIQHAAHWNLAVLLQLTREGRPGDTQFVQSRIIRSKAYRLPSQVPTLRQSVPMLQLLDQLRGRGISQRHTGNILDRLLVRMHLQGNSSPTPNDITAIINTLV